MVPRHSSRPPCRRPPGGRKKSGRKKSGLTARAVVLGLVLCAVVLALAYPLRTYLAQRSEIAQLSAAKGASQQRVAQLQQQQDELADPATTIAAAHRRLHYVLPGETAYIVVPPVGDEPPSPRPQRSAVPGADASGPWYSRLWHTTRTADTGAR